MPIGGWFIPDIGYGPAPAPTPRAPEPMYGPRPCMSPPGPRIPDTPPFAPYRPPM